MRHPFRAIPLGKFRAIFVPLLILTLVVMGMLNVVGGPLVNGTAPQGIVSFELAGSETSTQAVLDSWSPGARVRAGFSLGFDFLFLILYSSTIGLACVWGSSILQSRHRSLAMGGLLIAWAQWLAALLDAVENAALLVILTDSTAAPWPQIARWCALPKFALVFLGVGYSVLSLVLWLWNTTSRDAKTAGGAGKR